MRVNYRLLLSPLSPSLVLANSSSRCVVVLNLGLPCGHGGYVERSHKDVNLTTVPVTVVSGIRMLVSGVVFSYTNSRGWDPFDEDDRIWDSDSECFSKGKSETRTRFKLLFPRLSIASPCRLLPGSRSDTIPLPSSTWNYPDSRSHSNNIIRRGR